jgi:competence protein ComEC
VAQLSNIPMVRLVIPFTVGVILYTISGHNIGIGIIASMIAVLLGVFISNKYFFQQHYHFRWVFGIGITLTLIFAGYLIAQVNKQIHYPSHFSKTDQHGSLLRLKLIEPVSEKTNSFQVVGKTTHIINHEQVKKATGKILLYLEKDSIAAGLKYGDVILIENLFQEIQPAKNPDAFNYRKFLSNQNIYHQAYRRSGDWYKTNSNEGIIFIKTAHLLREKALEVLHENNLSGKEFSVASALLLGYREYLDEDLQREFAGAGAMHILCVSGLHVGIIFLALNLIFGFLNKLPKGRIIKTIIIVLLIWFYAAITGFSPSVLRASTMFSFVAIGQSFNRSTNIYNTLAASAFFLILIDPYIITKIGFQLSYIAVISIVFLQPVFYRQFYIPNKVINYAWAIITVSLAAQIGTGPLALYYFNQFPNYFVLTNLIVIPMAGLIINTGLVFFMISPIAFLADLAGKILSWIIYFLHSAVRLVESLPYSTSSNIYINLTEVLLIFGILTTFSLFWIRASKVMIQISILLGLILSVSFSIRTFQNSNRNKIIVYHVPNATAIDLVAGKNCYFWACDNTLDNPRNIYFNIHDHRIKSGTTRQDPILINTSMNDPVYYKTPIHIKGSFIQFKDQTIKIADNRTFIYEGLSFFDTLDLLILTGSVSNSLKEVASTFPARKIIIDSSASFRKADNWLKDCDSLQMNCWSVRHNGAFEIALK